MSIRKYGVIAAQAFDSQKTFIKYDSTVRVQTTHRKLEDGTVLIDTGMFLYDKPIAKLSLKAEPHELRNPSDMKRTLSVDLGEYNKEEVRTMLNKVPGVRLVHRKIEGKLLLNGVDVTNGGTVEIDLRPYSNLPSSLPTVQKRQL